MFSGIVQTKGEVHEIKRHATELTLTIKAPVIVTPTLQIGASIAVNGVCLTVTAIQEETFTVAVMPETVRRTSLQTLTSGTAVNLERALQINDHLDGHIVQGHVDYCGRVRARIADEHAIRLLISLPVAYRSLVVVKGSIAVDGVSLTIVAINDDEFEVDLIPHSQAVTTLGSVQVGDQVNIETDILGKYVARQRVSGGVE